MNILFRSLPPHKLKKIECDVSDICWILNVNLPLCPKMGLVESKIDWYNLKRTAVLIGIAFFLLIEKNGTVTVKKKKKCDVCTTLACRLDAAPLYSL